MQNLIRVDEYLTAKVAARLLMQVGDEPSKIALGPKAFVRPNGAAFLCAGLARLEAEGAVFEFDFSENPQAAGYLTRMHFFDHLEVAAPSQVREHSAAGRFTHLMAVKNDTINAVVNTVLDMLVSYFENPREFIPAIEWALNEITDNILIHAESPVPGLVFAQTYENKRVDLAIVDSGKGLKASLGEAHPIESARHGLELAMQRGVTRGVGQGNGIAGTREILKVNGGTFSLWSDGVWYKEGPKTSAREEQAFPFGTGAMLSFDITQPIDLQETFIESSVSMFIEQMAESFDEGGIRIAEERLHFGSRVPAARVRRKVLAALPDMGEALVLNFDGVNGVSSSFIDELLGKLVEDIGESEYKRNIRVANMQESDLRRANVTIAQRFKTTRSDD